MIFYVYWKITEEKCNLGRSIVKFTNNENPTSVFANRRGRWGKADTLTLTYGGLIYI